MNRNVKEFIESGVLEAYVMGSASAGEEQEVLRMKNNYAQVQEAITELETDLEELARSIAVPPPPNMWNRIETEFNEIATIPNNPLEIGDRQKRQYRERENKENQYIHVESESTHMRIHKNWKYVFAAVFILGKIFLGCAIYFYLENRQAQQNIQELKQELRRESKVLSR
ncbi:hypothetical protein ACFQ3S_06415 [Mucilaginibacter terrae]|uniref:hypothetical protein n=1 Tax=Mucilaginibacter terrae TaxID=1955052 RepID=UPI003636ED05